MPRDQRLWMTFPIDFDEHPKVVALTDAAFRAFVEMNAYSRRFNLDGVLPSPVADKRWTPGVMAELVASHPDRPLVCSTSGAYVIRDYAEHQETTGSIEARRLRNQENGKKGGRPPKNREETQPVTESVSGSGSQSGAHEKAESRVQSDFFQISKSQSLDTRARVSTDAIEVSAMTKRLAAQKGITSLRVVVDAIHRHTSARVTADQAFQLSTHLLDKSKTWPDAPQRYVLRCIENGPAEVEKHLYEQIGVAS